jgi:hypothetical protein
MKKIAVCDCDRKTGKESRNPKNPKATQHVNDICNFCGYYVKYIDVEAEGTKFGNYMQDHSLSRTNKTELDLRSDYLYNFGYPLHLGGRK